MKHDRSGTESSPEILCVSNCHESTLAVRDAVASHCPTETIETTTDPTVVPELLAVWDVDCVVADAEMHPHPLDGTDLRSTVRETHPQIPVIVVAESTTSHTDLVVVGEGDEQSVQLSERLAQICSAESGGPTESKLESESISVPTSTADSRSPSADRQVQRLVETDKRCELIGVFETILSECPQVSEYRLWVYESTNSKLEPTSWPDDTARPSPPASVVSAVETGKPQQSTTETASDSEPSFDTNESTSVAYPLGKQGAVAVVFETPAPTTRRALARLSTVAGACLDHIEAYTALETRFRQTAEHNRLLSQFARTVAHDLNSPLSVIYGRIELSLAEPSKADIHLQAALNAAQRVDSLVTDHLQAIEATDENEVEPVSVQTVAIQAWRIIDPSTARLQVEPQLEAVEANAIRLQQLFENLIRNAIEHGSEESVGLGSVASRDPHAVFDDETESVTVTIKPTETGFAVCDDGPGIPPADRETVFESGYTTTESGSGLGLYIVHEIIEDHDWSISVTESDDGGARFEIDTQ